MSLVLNIMLVGRGLVGSELLRQIANCQPQALADTNLDLRIRVVATSKTMETHDSSLTAPDFCGVNVDTDLYETPVGLAREGHTVVVDCTASAAATDAYLHWLRSGCHVVTANKKANSGPLGYYQALRQAQNSDPRPCFFYEANVGAGLPVISTIRDSLRTGDKVLEIEGILSGTLSYLFNELDGDKNPFSAVVLRARAAGFTEPEPRDDLGGVDVARKVVILAREIGMNVELDEVPVKSLVPEELRGPDVTTEQFLTRLPEFDTSLTASVTSAADAGEVLRYVGSINKQTGKCSVELRRYKRSHPFGALQGSDNIVSMRTERYDAQPLVIRGPGAGAAVTAGGVFADIYRVAASLGAH